MQLVHVVAGDEALDFDDVGALEGHLVELVLVQRDVAALGYLVAFDPILLRHLLAGLRIDHLVTNPMPGVAVENVEMDAVTGCGRWKQGNTAGHERELEISFPVRSSIHGKIH